VDKDVPVRCAEHTAEDLNWKWKIRDIGANGHSAPDRLEAKITTMTNAIALLAMMVGAQGNPTSADIVQRGLHDMTFTAVNVMGNQSELEKINKDSASPTGSRRSTFGRKSRSRSGSNRGSGTRIFSTS